MVRWARRIQSGKHDVTRRLFNGLALGCGVTFMAGFGGLSRALAPGAKRWDRWQAHAPASTRAIDHSAWSDLLNRFVVVQPGVNLVRYGDFDEAATQQLDDYLTLLHAVPVSSLNRDQQFTFWVNLYNAQTVRTVLDHMPVSSIQDINISPGLFATGPWGADLMRVEDQDLSLNDIEHRILRPIWQDPRIHYAVNCASIGCPDLQPRAFIADTLEQQLNGAAEAFVNSERAIQIDGDRLILSSLYDWFYEDFGGTDASLLDHLKLYAAPTLKARLDGFSAISDDRYDWSLNAA
ncbi:DUF547 domain-containing protein [Hwanghaeella sp. 1Z406]|jgi:hypothetical protein|uniref:DUF547 domain-containing protein n=1 Tax=Hwanghaeella sp. 1Z406 TaxID=3402811 RepID=UPI0026CCFA6A|tara:strand:- start:23386 stop:24264 length:879 start_codon:yes stop_codon:yes gene_type:complete